MYSKPKVIFTGGMLAAHLLLSATLYAQYNSIGFNGRVDAPHPGYDFINIRPTDWPKTHRTDYQLTGLDLLPDGRMVVCNYLNHSSHGNSVFLLSGGLDATGPGDVEWEEIATDLYCPLGVEVVEGEIFITEKDKLSKLTPDGSGGWDYSVVYDKHNPFVYDNGDLYDNYYHWFSHGPVYNNGKFYWTTSGFYQYHEETDTEIPHKHGVFMEYDPVAKTHTPIAYGFRNPGGIGKGPLGTVWLMESQGDWMPTCKLLLPEQGDWYGFGGTNHAICKAPHNWNCEEKGPAVWLTYTDIAYSSNEPLYLPKGNFAGQFVSGDNRLGVMMRVFVEKVGTTWQGAGFYFSGGFDSGIERNILAPDSLTILTVGMGDGTNSNWYWRQNWLSDVHRLEPKEEPVFEILSIRNIGARQFEVYFTKPANGAAGQAGNYQVDFWENNPSKGYGAGDQENHDRDIPIDNVALSANGKVATITLRVDVPKHRLGRQVRIALEDEIRSADGGEELWTKLGDYTLHEYGPADWPIYGCTDPGFQEYNPQAHIDDGSCSEISAITEGEFLPGQSMDFKVENTSEGLLLNLPFKEAYRVDFINVRGRVQFSLEGDIPAQRLVSGNYLGQGVYTVRVEVGSQRHRRTVAVF